MGRDSRPATLCTSATVLRQILLRWSVAQAAHSTSAPVAKHQSVRSSMRWRKSQDTTVSQPTVRLATAMWCASSWTQDERAASSVGTPRCRCTRAWPGPTSFSAMADSKVSLRVPADAHIAILAGGEGTRLWPLSRSRRPKQLLQLGGERTLIQRTVDRLRPLVEPRQILIITERSHADDLRAQLPELPASSIIVEPTRRG